MKKPFNIEKEIKNICLNTFDDISDSYDHYLIDNNKDRLIEDMAYYFRQHYYLIDMKTKLWQQKVENYKKYQEKKGEEK